MQKKIKNKKNQGDFDAPHLLADEPRLANIPIILPLANK
jgi:hypothetical protein